MKEVTRVVMLYNYLMLIVRYAAFIFSSLWIVHLLVFYTQNSLQMDFSGYYSAAKSFLHGLNPYMNNLQYWDGVAMYNHSRFLYAPLSLYFFAPLALLNYQTAKVVWMVVNLLLLVALYLLSCRALLLNPRRYGLLFLTVTCLFFPTYTYFERGQVDLLTINLLLGTYLFFEKKKFFWGWMLLMLATAFKINVVLLVPFFLINNISLQNLKAKILPGFMAGLLFLVLMLVANPILFPRYITRELPRILHYAENGTVEMLNTELKIDPQLNEKGLTKKEGKVYQREVFPFFGNATVIRSITIVKKYQLLLLGVLYSASLAAYYYLLHRLKGKNGSYLRFLVSLQFIMLISPLTWVMNLVWLLAAVPLIVSLKSQFRRKDYLGLFIASFIFFIPDFVGMGSALWANNKYVLAQLLFLGYTLYLSKFCLEKPAEVAPSFKKKR